MSDRASVFDNVADFEVADFAPKKASTAKPDVASEKIRAVSEASSFRSREPIPARVERLGKREPRRFRTGRNVQLNIKVSQETLDTFYAIADAQDWILAETFAYALASLQAHLDECEVKDGGKRGGPFTEN
jgi:hypothetical protein